MGNYPDRCGYCDEKHPECTCQPVSPGWRMTRAHALAAINERFNGTPFAAESVMVSRSEFAAICSEHDQASLDLAAHVLELVASAEQAERDYAALQARIAELEARNRVLEADNAILQNNLETMESCDKELRAYIEAVEARSAASERDAGRYQRLHKGWRDRFIAEQTQPFCGSGGYLSDLADEQAHYAADQIDAAIDAHAQGQAGEE